MFPAGRTGRTGLAYVVTQPALAEHFLSARHSSQCWGADQQKRTGSMGPWSTCSSGTEELSVGYTADHVVLGVRMALT